VDEQGNLLHNETIYPHPPQNDIKMAEKKIASLVSAYKIDYIAIGDGTASRETEAFLSKMSFAKTIKILLSAKQELRFTVHPILPEKNFPNTI
jgi:uncharacterized protein